MMCSSSVTEGFPALFTRKKKTNTKPHIAFPLFWTALPQINLVPFLICATVKSDVSIELQSKQIRKKKIHTYPVSTLQNQFIWSEGNRQGANPAAVVIHTSSKTSKHVKMCKLTNTWLPPSGKLWLSGCMRVCICGGTCMYDYRSGNNSPTGVNEASDWRSSLPVSTELWKTVWLWELTRLREPRWGDRASRGAGVDGKCQTPLRRTSLISTQTALHLGDDPCLSHLFLHWHPE